MKTSRFVAARIPDRLLVSACTLFSLVISNATMLNAHAATVNWVSNTGGSFTEAANWDNGIPGTADTAVFRRGGLTYDIDFGTQVINDRLRVGNDTVSFRASDASATYSLLDSSQTATGIVVGELPGERGVLNDYLGNLTTSSLILGQGAGSSGVMNLFAGTFNVTRTLQVGSSSGTGELNVLNGAVLNNTSDGFALWTGSSITVSGPGSRWIQSYSIQITVPSRIQITDGGKVNMPNLYFIRNGVKDAVIVDGTNSVLTLYQLGSLEMSGGSILIKNGGKMSTSYVSLANSATQTMVTVDGPGSIWTHQGSRPDIRFDGHLYLPGSNAAPSLVLKNGGTFATTQVDLLGNTATGVSISIDGPGTRWVNSGALLLHGRVSVTNGGSLSSTGLLTISSSVGGLLGNGTIDASVSNTINGIVAPAGFLTVTGSYNQASSGNLQIDLSGLTAGLEYDRLVVAGAAALDGVLKISLINGFVPAQGNTFDILDAASISGHFANLQLPTLPTPLGWDTSALYTTGTVSVVPEPPTFALLAIGALGICLHRKRRLK